MLGAAGFANTNLANPLLSGKRGRGLRLTAWGGAHPVQGTGTLGVTQLMPFVQGVGWSLGNIEETGNRDCPTTGQPILATAALLDSTDAELDKTPLERSHNRAGENLTPRPQLRSLPYHASCCDSYQG